MMEARTAGDAFIVREAATRSGEVSNLLHHDARDAGARCFRRRFRSPRGNICAV